MALIAASADTREVFDDVARVYLPVGAAVLVVVLLLLALVVLRDREGGERTPSDRTSNTGLEIGYVAVLTVVAGALAWITLAGTREQGATAARAIAAPQAGPSGLTVRAVASKWNWRFEYPGGVAQVGNGADDPATLVVPSGGAVRFRLTTIDVAHAFWIPEARYKFDAVPGRANVFDMQFDAGRDYSGSRCSEFCGEFHEQMRFRVQVRSPASFRRWLAERQREVR